MEKNIKFDKEKVWKVIEKDQKKKKRKKFMFFYLTGFLLLSVGSFYLLSNSGDNTILEEKGHTITQSVEKNPTIKENSEIQSSNDAVSIISNESHVIVEEAEKSSETISNEVSEIVDQVVINTVAESTRAIMSEVTEGTIQKVKENDENVTKLYSEIDKISGFDKLSGIAISPLRYESEVYELRRGYLKLPEIVKPFSIARKNIFVQSSFLFGKTKISGSENLADLWNTTQSLNFINSNSLGLELEFRNNLSLRSGFRLDIISTTYDLTQNDVEEGISENDTLSIYANRVLTGDRNYTTSIERRIVNHNNIYRIGLPVAIGYKIAGDKFDVKIYGQSTLSYYQSFRGIVSTHDFRHEFDQDNVNDTYFNNKWSVRLSGLILLEKRLSKSLKINAGIEMAFSERLLSSKESFNLDYRGAGLSMGLSYGF